MINKQLRKARLVDQLRTALESQLEEFAARLWERFDADPPKTRDQTINGDVSVNLKTGILLDITRDLKARDRKLFKKGK